MLKRKIVVLLLLCGVLLPAYGRAPQPLPVALAAGEAWSAEAGFLQKFGDKRKKNRKKKKTKARKPQARISPERRVLPPEVQRKYDYFYLEAVRQKLLGKYDVAFELLQHCLDICPEAASAQYELAQYCLYLKQSERGLHALEQAVKYEPDNFWYCQGLANLYVQQDKPDKAIALLEDMSARFTGKLDPLYDLLTLYNRQEDYARVIGVLDRLEQRTGKSEQLTMEKFRIYLQMEDVESAFREMESLVEEYPMELNYKVMLGDVYRQNGKKDEAYAIYRDVLAQEPDNAMAMYSLASYYEETGQQELYRKQLDSLLVNRKVASSTKAGIMRQLIVQNEREGGDSTAIIRLFDRILPQEQDDVQLPLLYAQYLISKGMNKACRPVLRQVLDIDPTNTPARMTLLGEAINEQDYAAITRLCEAGVESNPNMLEYYFYLAIAYNHDERTDDALAICRQALKQVTKDSKKEVISDFYSIIGDAYHTKKQLEEAYAAYDSALVYNPENIATLNNYAYYLSLERRDLDRAEEMSYKTIKAEPDNATYLDTYAWILFEKGNYAEARIYIDNAMLADGEKSCDVIEHCGDIYYMTGDVEGALKYWKQALELGSESATLKQKIAQKKYIPYETTTE